MRSLLVAVLCLAVVWAQPPSRYCEDTDGPSQASGGTSASSGALQALANAPGYRLPDHGSLTVASSTPDVTPPTLAVKLSKTLLTAPFNRDNNAVTIYVNYTDDISGVTNDVGARNGGGDWVAQWANPSGELMDLFCAAQNEVGTSLQGGFLAPCSWFLNNVSPQPGIWRLLWVTLKDRAGNYRNYTVPEQDGSLEVVNGNYDSQPPQLTYFYATPSYFVGASAVILHITVNATDLQSDVTSVIVTYINPLGGRSSRSADINCTIKAWSMTTKVSTEGAFSGSWQFEVQLEDAAKNVITYASMDLAGQAFTSAFTITDGRALPSSADTTEPVCSSISFSPSSIDASSAPVTVSVSLVCSEAVEGLLILQPPAGAPFQRPLALDATDSFIIPQHAPAGLWTVMGLLVIDESLNAVVYGRCDPTFIPACSFITNNGGNSSQSGATLQLEGVSFSQWASMALSAAAMALLA